LAFKVIEFNGNREPVYDFLLLISDLAPSFGVTPSKFMEKLNGSWN